MTGTAARGVLAIAILVGGSATTAADPGTPAEKIAAGIRVAAWRAVTPAFPGGGFKTRNPSSRTARTSGYRADRKGFF